MATNTIDRVAMATALAKAQAYAAVGKQAEAEEWARKLVMLLHCSNILNAEHVKGWASVGTDHD